MHAARSAQRSPTTLTMLFSSHSRVDAPMVIAPCPSVASSSCGWHCRGGCGKRRAVAVTHGPQGSNFGSWNFFWTRKQDSEQTTFGHLPLDLANWYVLRVSFVFPTQKHVSALVLGGTPCKVVAVFVPLVRRQFRPKHRGSLLVKGPPSRTRARATASHDSHGVVRVWDQDLHWGGCNQGTSA